MALPDVSFTNNLGTISFKRPHFEISDELDVSADGPSVARNRTKSIRVWGAIKKDNNEMLNAISSEGTTSYGEPGTLTLPHAVLTGIKLQEISYEQGIWAEWGQASASFVDEEINDAEYSLTWFGHTLRDAQIDVNPGVIRLGEKTVHNYNGFFRQQLGHNMVAINVQGMVFTNEDSLPAGLENSMTRITSSPSGYPELFDMLDAIPEASGTPYKECLITGASINWEVEKRLANVSIDIIAQPQELE